VKRRKLSLRVQQTLEALDIFRVAAGFPIIRVTEKLHHTIFWKVRVLMLQNCPNFSSQKQSRDREMADLSSKGWCDARIVGQ